MQDFGRRSFLAGAAALGLANAARAASPMGTAKGPVQASWPSLVAVSYTHLTLPTKRIV